MSAITLTLTLTLTLALMQAPPQLHTAMHHIPGGELPMAPDPDILKLAFLTFWYSYQVFRTAKSQKKALVVIWAVWPSIWARAWRVIWASGPCSPWVWYLPGEPPQLRPPAHARLPTGTRAKEAAGGAAFTKAHSMCETRKHQACVILTSARLRHANHDANAACY